MDTSRLAVFRGSLLWILPVVPSISGFCTRVLPVLPGLRPLVLLALRVLAVPKTCNMSSIRSVLRPSVHRVDNFVPIVFQKTFSDGPTSGSWRKLLSVGATGVLRVPTVFRDYVLRVLAVFRGSILRILLVLQVFRGPILWMMPVLGVLYCSYSQ